MFKVVNASLMSAVVKGPLAVQYVIGAWVEAQIGGLFVFTSLQSARDFLAVAIVIGEHEDLRVFSCTCEEEVPIALLSNIMLYSDVVAAWEGKKGHEIQFKGALAYKRVKLEEEVRYDT